MVFRKLAPLVVLCLAACSQGSDIPEAEQSASAAPAAKLPVQPAPPIEALASEVPFAFRGVWDWTGGTCEETSDMRMEIGPTSVTFYESIGMVEAVREEGDTLSLDLAMEGEGEQWRQTTVLRLVDGGKLLESTLEDPSGTGSLRYKRCPGETPAL